MPDPTLIEVGDFAETEFGTRRVEHIYIALRPQRDPAAEEFFAEVTACETSLPFVVDLVGGRWAYGTQVRSMRKAETVDD
jgi:hypothetical protein